MKHMQDKNMLSNLQLYSDCQAPGYLSTLCKRSYTYMQCLILFIFIFHISHIISHIPNSIYHISCLIDHISFVLPQKYHRSHLISHISHMICYIPRNLQQDPPKRTPHPVHVTAPANPYSIQDRNGVCPSYLLGGSVGRVLFRNSNLILSPHFFKTTECHRFQQK